MLRAGKAHFQASVRVGILIKICDEELRVDEAGPYCETVS